MFTLRVWSRVAVVALVSCFPGFVSSLEAQCLLEDVFADLSNWDVPAPNAGLTLESCQGIPPDVFVGDTGTMEVQDGKMILTPGPQDTVDLGDTLALTGLKADVVAAAGIGEANYRVRLNVLATDWLEDVALFTRAHYLFDSETALFDPWGFLGAGFNHEVRLPDGGQEEAAIFADGRGQCIFTEIPPDQGTPEVLMNPFLGGTSFLPGMLYTVITDVDGDDEVGPLIVRVKIFPEDQPEPEGFMAEWMWSVGLGVPADEEDHGVLLAALGDTNRPQEEPLPHLEVSELSICEIPRDQKTVAVLQCIREFDGAVVVTWANLSEAEDEPIEIRVNGVPEPPVDAFETMYVIESPPAGDLLISVTNFAGTVECSLCQNDPPDVVIDGPAAATLEEGMAGLLFDASGSSDPEGGALAYFWEVASMPAGASPEIDDALAPAITLRVDQEGAYVLRLTITDGGCPGDELPQSGEGEWTVTIGPRGVGPFLRGDCNGDGAVTGQVTDAVFFLRYNFVGGQRPPCFASCDADGNGSLGGVTDGVYILQFNFRGGPAPVDPFPDCGLGSLPSDETLGCETPRPDCP